MPAAEWIVRIFASYILAGVAFAAVFVTAGIHRVDPLAEHAPIGFRLIIVPGVVGLWPWLLLRWLRSPRS